MLEHHVSLRDVYLRFTLMKCHHCEIYAGQTTVQTTVRCEVEAIEHFERGKTREHE